MRFGSGPGQVASGWWMVYNSALEFASTSDGDYRAATRKELNARSVLPLGSGRCPMGLTSEPLPVTGLAVCARPQFTQVEVDLRSGGCRSSRRELGVPAQGQPKLPVVRHSISEEATRKS